MRCKGNPAPVRASFIKLAVALLACVAPMPNAFAADSGLTVHTDTDTAILSPQTPDTCGPTLVEHYTRHLLHELPPFGSKKFLLVTQRFRAGTGCFEGNDPPGHQPVSGLRSNEKTNIHVVLNCRCNSAPVDLTVPVSDLGIDISAAIRTGPSVDLAVRQLPESGHSQ